MKYLNLSFLSLSLIFTGCSDTNSSTPMPDSKPDTKKVTGADVKQEASEAVDAAKELTSQKKEEYLAELKKKLEGMDNKIKNLEAKGSELKDEAKKKWNAKLATLKEQRQKIGVKYDEVTKSSVAAWQDLKQGLDSAWDEMQKAYGNARQQFEKKTQDNI